MSLQLIRVSVDDFFVDNDHLWLVVFLDCKLAVEFFIFHNYTTIFLLARPDNATATLFVYEPLTFLRFLPRILPDLTALIIIADKGTISVEIDTLDCLAGL